MKAQEWMRAAGAAVAIVLAAFGPAGCNEDDSSGSNELDGYFESHPFVADPRSGGASSGVVSVTPASASVNQIGGKAVFSASGGDGSYTWNVANTSMGAISGSGAQGVYTALLVGNNDVIVYDGAGNAALAKVSGTSVALSASASPSSVSPDDSYATLKASGGRPPYTWSVADDTLGNIVGGKTGDSVVYQRYGAGDNVATVTDDLGNKANVLIKQP